MRCPECFSPDYDISPDGYRFVCASCSHTVQLAEPASTGSRFQFNGKDIWRRREAAGLTRHQVAELLGTGEPSVVRMETTCEGFSDRDARFLASIFDLCAARRDEDRQQTPPAAQTK